MLKFKTGDSVIITAGKDKGQKGSVEKVLPGSLSLVVTGKNLYKKHVKPKDKNQKGGIVEKARPLAFTKVRLICSKCNKPTRVGFMATGDSSTAKRTNKVRICKKCNKPIG